MSTDERALGQIYNFRAINEGVGTAGQPSEEQLRRIGEAGYEAVINLALPTSDNAIPHEGSIVTSLGMSYFHVPVNFQKPTARDFETFCGLMKALGDRRVFVHCAANMRVSAFVFLYRVLHERIRPAEAERDLQAIWQPNEVWAGFMEDQLRGCKAEAGESRVEG